MSQVSEYASRARGSSSPSMLTQVMTSKNDQEGVCSIRIVVWARAMPLAVPKYVIDLVRK